jgi:riboflavin kinase/FMN adenylyltransferase
MQIIRGFSAVPEALKGAVIAIGNFDGLHLGHRSVLEEARQVAEKLGAPCAAFTFYPHPREHFRPELSPLSIYPFRMKASLMKAAGMNGLIVSRFTQPFSTLTAEAFVQEVLVNALAARHVVTGEHFAFGAKRHGNAEFLKAASRAHGFGYSAVPGVNAEGGPCSSTRIREYLRAGDIAAASALLGRPYAMEGRVVHGDGKGRQLGFPTANILPHKLCLPAYGVYAVHVSADGLPPLHGVANLGIRPTIGGEVPRLEVHCFDMNDDLYGKRLSVTLKKHLRPERKFDTLDALKAQIALDGQHARNLP